MRIVLTRKWPEVVERELDQTFDVTFNVDDVPMTAAQLAAMARDYDVICPTVSDRITAALLDQPDRRVRMLCNYGAGVDHIDLDACRRRGVIVTNTPDVLSEATAELAMLLMLMVARRAGEGERELRADEWRGWRPTHLVGRQVTGKKLGLVGFGSIAQALARKARGLDMEILYHSRHRADPQIGRALGATFCETLSSLLRAADFVSLHIPGGPTTHHMIGSAELAMMQPHACLINTARGTVVDEEALAQALKQAKIAGAGLDVYEREPNISPSLTGSPNVVLLPHLGSATVETRVAMGRRAMSNLEAWSRGLRPADLVA